MLPDSDETPFQSTVTPIRETKPMKEQLRLLNTSNPQWRLDERTCERGRAGISKAREALAHAGETRLGVSRTEAQHSTAA
jgi:hypothetical protein